jgi:hypothetical protein
MSVPNPFLASQDWNDTVREAKYNDGVPYGQPNPYETGTNPATGEVPYGIPLMAPDAVKVVTGKR